MAYNEKLDERISVETGTWRAVRKKMFGGTCYLVRGNMMCGVYRDSLIVRVGDREAAGALGRASVRPFDITGRAMKGWLMIEEPGYRGARLRPWLERARAFVKTLPEK